MTQVVVLSPFVCLAFKGKRSFGEGYTGEQAGEIIRRLEGHCMWAGTEATINVCPIMLGKAQHILVRARGFIRMQRLQKLTAPKPSTDSMTMTKKSPKPMTMKVPESQHGKVCQADKYWMKQLEKGYGHPAHTQWLIDKRLESLTHPLLLDLPYSSGGDTNDEPYESALEPQSAVSGNPLPYEVTDSEGREMAMTWLITAPRHHTIQLSLIGIGCKGSST